MDIMKETLNEISENEEYAYLLLTHLGGLHALPNKISLYFYNSIILENTNPKLSKIMHEFCLENMHDLNTIAKICFRLGVDPRLWESQDDALTYWSPGYNIYSSSQESMLKNIVREELLSIDICKEHISFISEPIIQSFLKQMIIHSQKHIEILNEHIIL